MLYDAERRWVNQALCRTTDPNIFFTNGAAQLGRTPSPELQAAWDEAKKICYRCPVFAECRRDTLGEDFGVWGGRDEHQRHLERRRMVRRAPDWAPEKRLEWAEELARLRAGALTWADIQRMTGIVRTLAEALVAEWREHVASLPVAEVIDLPLPEPEKKPFPDRPSGRDMWVRHNSLVGSAHYMGETPDGVWIKVQIKAGRGNSIKWVRREDVQFHDPKPKNIVEYLGRPDGPNARAC